MTDKLDTAKMADVLRTQLERRAALRSGVEPSASRFKHLYRAWCIVESQRELERDFQFVRLVRSHTVELFLEYVGTLSFDEKRLLLMALSKKMRDQDALSSTEIAAANEYFAYFQEQKRIGGQVVQSLRAPRTALALSDDLNRSDLSVKKSRTAARHLVAESLADVAGTVILNRPEALHFALEIEDWFVLSSFEFVGNVMFRYRHHIHRDEATTCASDISGTISILNWMGILPETAWKVVAESDLRTVVADVRILCEYSLKQIGELLRDFGSLDEKVRTTR